MRDKNIIAKWIKQLFAPPPRFKIVEMGDGTFVVNKLVFAGMGEKLYSQIGLADTLQDAENIIKSRKIIKVYVCEE